MHRPVYPAASIISLLTGGFTGRGSGRQSSRRPWRGKRSGQTRTTRSCWNGVRTGASAQVKSLLSVRSLIRLEVATLDDCITPNTTRSLRRLPGVSPMVGAGVSPTVGPGVDAKVRKERHVMISAVGAEMTAFTAVWRSPTRLKNGSCQPWRYRHRRRWWCVLPAITCPAHLAYPRSSDLASVLSKVLTSCDDRRRTKKYGHCNANGQWALGSVEVWSRWRGLECGGDNRDASLQL